jgi:3-oxoacyl-(acyl-carrier-protein) synthase
VLRTVERESKAQADRDKETTRRLESLQQDLVKLTEREDAQALIDEAEAAGTRKGLEFEEMVHAALETIANGRGDSARHTGSEQAEGGGKKGDTLVEVGGATREFPLGRIVFEAKEKRLSKPAAWKELDQAMDTRSADFAVLVCAGDERVPANTEELVEYEGNKLFVAVDRDQPGGLSLEVAYRLAVARVSMSKDSTLRLDAAAVRDAISEARNALDQVRTVKSHITSASTSAERAYEAVEKLGDTVKSQLDRVDELVAIGEDEPSDDEPSDDETSLEAA